MKVENSKWPLANLQYHQKIKSKIFTWTKTNKSFFVRRNKSVLHQKLQINIDIKFQKNNDYKTII